MSYSPLSQSNYNSNYILAGDASFGLKGFANYSNTAGVAPVTGTGGSPATTLAITTASPLSGTSSFLWAKSGANRQGEGFSYDFTIDSALRGQQLAINFLYEILSGSYATGDMSVWVYNITDNAMVQPSGYQIISTGIAGPSQQMVFQASATSTSYRLIFHTASTNASAYSLKFDNITVTPQTGGYGLKAKPNTIQKFTSGSGTYTTPAGVYQIRVRMVGGGAGGTGSGTAVNVGGTGGATTFGTSLLVANGGSGSGAGSLGGPGGTASLGTGPVGTALTGGSGASGSYTRTAQDISGGSGAATPFGAGGAGSMQGIAGRAAPDNTGAGGGGGGMTNAAAVYSGGGGGAGGYVDAIISGSTLASTFAYSVGTGGAGGAAGTSGAAGYAGGSGYIEVEEYYYGDNVIISDSAATRAFTFYATGTPNSAVNSTVNNITWSSAAAVTDDTLGCYNYATGAYTVKVPGKYQWNATLEINRTSGTATQLASVRVTNATTGINYHGSAASWVSAGSETIGVRGSGVVSANAGDVLYFKSYAVGTGTAWGAGITGSNISLSLIQGPEQIQAATIVAAAAVAATSTHFATASTLTGWTELEDTTNSFNPTTGIFTAPAPGLYRYTGSYSPANTALPSSIYLYKNGSNYQNRRSSGYSNGTVYPNPTLTGLIRLNTNDQVYFVAQNSSGVATATDAGGTSFSIERISGVN